MNGKEKIKRWERTNVSNLWKFATTGGYYARVKVNGKEKWRSLKTKVFGVAKLRLTDFEREERIKGKRSAEAATVIEGGRCGILLNHYLADLRLSTSIKGSSKVRIETASKALGKTWPGFAGADVRQITSTQCKEWAVRAQTEGTKFTPPLTKAKPQKGMSPSAFNQTLTVLRGVFALAVKLGLIYVDPSEEIARMTPTKKRLALPSTKQFNEIIEAIASAGARQSKDCADMVKFLAYSGLRLGEAELLTWDRVDFENSTLRVIGNDSVTLKTETSERTIPLFPTLKQHLQAMRTKTDDPQNAKILKVSECQKSLTRACKLVGVKRMTHHDLRHLFATRCIEAGVDIPTVSRWLGHADGGALAMRTYGHLRQDHSFAQAAKVTW